jgi:hypothetical protein
VGEGEVAGRAFRKGKSDTVHQQQHKKSFTSPHSNTRQAQQQHDQMEVLNVIFLHR